MSRYRVVALVEITSACQTRCTFCERDARASASRPMSEGTFATLLRRLRPRDVRHAEITGYGEPLLHPHVDALLARLAGHPVPFRLCTNGELLGATRLAALDGLLERIVVPLSAVDEKVAAHVQPGLDHERVLANLRQAARLRSTRLEVAVPALPECIDALAGTVAHLHALGVQHVSVASQVGVHGGALCVAPRDVTRARAEAERLGLPDASIERVPFVAEMLETWRTAHCRCVPRNASLLVDTAGRYHDCFQDAQHTHVLGQIDLMTVREALEERERREAPEALCAVCALRDGFGPEHLASVLRSRGAAPDADSDDSGIC